jgi:unconventional prefoldin RPB5 interactor 1
MLQDVARHGSLAATSACQDFACSLLAKSTCASFFFHSTPPIPVMAASPQSTLEGIERRRAQLQESIEKLQKALMQWTMWESDYQALSEELRDDEDATPAEMREMAKNLGSTLLNEKEVEELLGKDLQTKRTANQVIDLISRRIDYVQQNGATIEKQLDTAEKQLAGVDILLEPGVDNEEGLPMMDIEEELDEEGNEVASNINQTGQAAAEIVEVLRKAGLQKALLDKEKSSAQEQDNPSDTPPQTSLPTATPKDVTSNIVEPSKATSASGNETDTAATAKKSVSFAEDTKPGMYSGRSTLERDGYNDALADMNFTRGTKVIELDEDDNEIASYPIIPQGESPEDAELRRQMLQYGLSEVGQIVAELDLDHPTAEYSEDEDDYGDDWGDETEDEEEDQYGRNVKPVVTDAYRKQMLELEKKLNARMMENVGPESSDTIADHVDEIRTLRIRDDEQFDQALGTTKSETTDADSTPKKGVRFADALNVSEAPKPVREPAISQSATKPAPTMSDTIVERSTSTPDVTNPSTKPAKVSRFKSGRAGTSQTPQFLPTPALPQVTAVPAGPRDRVLANTVNEHSQQVVEPQAPDEFDATIMHREIQAEYHKARNRFIGQQGGYKPSEEDVDSPIVEEKDGKTKKVSRFMAARLKETGM